MDAETAAKIKSHKYGRRKLTSPAALNLLNNHLRNAKADGFRNALQQDQPLKDLVEQMNADMVYALGVFGLSAAVVNAHKMQFLNPNAVPLPKAVYLGYIDMNTGSLDDSERQDFEIAEKEYADHAGKLRARIALIWASLAVLNDVSNADTVPNRGGEVDIEENDPDGEKPANP